MRKRTIGLLALALLCSCGRREALPVYTEISDLQFADERLASCATETALSHAWPDAGRVTALRCNNAVEGRIFELGGIEQLVNLENVDLAHNEISDTTPLGELQQLKFIDLSYNVIEVFGPLRTRHVTYLNLDQNRITALDWLDSFLSLESLSLSHNRIEDISPLAGKVTLRELDLSHNDVADVSALSGLTALRHLDLSQNQIADIAALANLSKLENLSISSNPGLDIRSLSALTELSELNLDDDDLRDISPLRALTKLQRVTLHGNRLESVEPLFTLGGLTHIDVTDNPGLPCTEIERLAADFGTDVVESSSCSSPDEGGN